jgi:DNA-binding NtrC family response regulator
MRSTYHSYIFYGMIGATRAMQELFRRIERYAPTDAPVVITGETGTGKEMVARALHKYSNRQRSSFVAINCTALHEELLESELFGHERGAFTGAVKTHRGRFERAHNGTLFLDEIGDMPHSIQVKLLRVLEERKLERIGGESQISVDVRIVAATNVPLEKMVGAGRFRSDLYHRLAVLRIHVPALRERKGDIPLLTDFFLDMLNRRYRKNIQDLSSDSMQLLLDYYWPGNIRELRNVLERVYVETVGDTIEKGAFDEWERERDFLSVGAWSLQNYEYGRLSGDTILPQRGYPQHSNFSGKTPENSEQSSRALVPYNAGPIMQPGSDFDRQFHNHVIDGEYRVLSERQSGNKRSSPQIITPEILRNAFKKFAGNITAASDFLGIHKATFYRHMKKFGLDRDSMEV